MSCTMSLGKLVDYCVTDESEDEQSSVVSTDGVSFKEMVPDESADYFNLDCSTDDEQFTELKESDLDTLISSYQLSENVVGPHRTVKLLKSHSPPKMSFSTIKRKRLTTAGDDDYLSEKRTATRNTASNSGLTDCFDVKRDQVNAGSFNELFMTPPLITGFSDFRSSTGLPREIRSVLGGHRGCVNTLFWGRSTNNRHLLLSASMDGTIKIWNPLISRSSLWSKGLHNDAAIRCARWCPSSNLIASVGYDKALKIFDVEKDSEVFVGFRTHFSNCLAFHPETPHLILTGNLGSIDCWDTRKNGFEPERQFRADFREVQDIEFLPNGKEFICCSNFVSRDSSDKAIVAWDFRSGAVLSNQIYNERYHCTCLRIHPSEKWFLAQTNGSYVALFSTSRPYKMNKKKRLEGHKVEGYWIGMSVSPDGHYVYSGSADGSLYMYDFFSGHLKRTLRTSKHPCLAVDCHSQFHNVVATSSWKGEIYVFH